MLIEFKLRMVSLGISRLKLLAFSAGGGKNKIPKEQSGAPQPAPERAPDFGADVQKEMSSSSTAKQGGQRVQVGQPSRSGAPEPAASDGAVQFDNDDDKKLWRIRKALWADMLGGASSSFCIEQLEEQTARSARSRRKAIEDFHWFCGF